MAAEDRTVLVVLREGTAKAFHAAGGGPTKEIVQGVARWSVNASESLELHSAKGDLVATFRDWTFVKFVAEK